MNNLMHVVVGDWSDDGHGKTKTFLFKCNLPRSQVMRAYKVGAKKLGVNLSERLCCEYEDSLISSAHFQKFIDHGFVVDFMKDEFYWDEKDGSPTFEEALKKPEITFSIDPEFFTKLYLFTVKLGEPSFEYKEVLPEEVQIGGYGLFM